MKRKGQFGFLCLFITHLFFSAMCINLYDSDKLLSYVEFPRWLENDSEEGSLEFQFKTHKPNGYVLYCDDGYTKNNVLRITLHSGILHVYLQMGSIDNFGLQSTKEIYIGKQWNDMEWHHVKITLNLYQFIFQIDDLKKIVWMDDSNRKFTLASNVFIGGDRDGVYEGFTGCIINVAYPIGSLQKFPIAQTGNVMSTCEDTCSNEEQSTCLHHGQCVKHFQENVIKCECFGTGYGGRTCETEESIAYFNSETYMTRSHMESLGNSRVNKVQFRFRTNRPSGIILYSGNSETYFLVELYQGSLQVILSLVTGKVVLVVGDGQLHDGEWHSVFLKKFGKRVSLSVDNAAYYDASSFEHHPSEICSIELETVYLGGVKYPKYISQSESKINYDGCLQQVYVQEKSTELVQQGLLRNNIYTHVYGDIKNECRVVKAPIIQTVIPTQSVITRKYQVLTEKLQAKEVVGKLSETTVAWITTGICIGSIAMIFTLACGFHVLRKKYRGQFVTDQSMIKTRKSDYATTTQLANSDDSVMPIKKKIPISVRV